jgi:hypothetical protein
VGAAVGAAVGATVGAAVGAVVDADVACTIGAGSDAPEPDGDVPEPLQAEKTASAVTENASARKFMRASSPHAVRRA